MDLSNFIRPMARTSTKMYTTLPHLDHAATMDNYRNYVGGYNQRIATENAVIQAFNADVKNTITTTPPDDVKKVFIQLFFQKYRHITNPREYNILVDEFSFVHGNFIQKKRLQPIKPGIANELFSALIYEYNQQLNRLDQLRKRCHIVSPEPLPKLKIHPGEITSRMRNDYINLNISTKTIYNHRLRFQEAGIITDYEYHSHRRPVDVRLNPDILAFVTLSPEKKQKTENQSFTVDRWKNLPHNNVCTGTLIKEDRKKANVKNHLANAEVQDKNTYENTPFQPEEIPPAGKNQTAAGLASDNLREKITDIWQLSCELSEGLYYNYEGIPYRRWYYELRSGTLTDEETRVLFIQDFFKKLSKIYLHNEVQPSPGSWYKAIQNWLDNRFITFTGVPFDKRIIIENYHEYNWRCAYAIRFFKRRNWKGVLFPNIYLDPIHTHPENICFEYTKSIYKKNEKAKSRHATKRQNDREKSKLHALNLRKTKRLARKYVQGEITLPAAAAFITQNIGKEYVMNFEKQVKSLFDIQTS